MRGTGTAQAARARADLGGQAAAMVMTLDARVAIVVSWRPPEMKAVIASTIQRASRPPLLKAAARTLVDSRRSSPLR
ncbi:hypothetical protein DCC79_10715 [bacterium]|nr:MAG: hypothetical protein DCC79_10715 [bacterium]